MQPLENILIRVFRPQYDDLKNGEQHLNGDFGR